MFLCVGTRKAEQCVCSRLQQELRLTDHFGMHMVGGKKGWVEKEERMRARNSNLLRVAWQIFSADVYRKTGWWDACFCFCIIHQCTPNMFQYNMLYASLWLGHFSSPTHCHLYAEMSSSEQLLLEAFSSGIGWKSLWCVLLFVLYVLADATQHHVPILLWMTFLLNRNTKGQIHAYLCNFECFLFKLNVMAVACCEM